MMPFEQFPYTNFHELNTDWLIKTVKEVKDKTENIDASVAEANAAALSAAESAESIKELFVTPDMYGAYGDGVHDDTNAFNEALNSGKPVVIPVGIYYLTQTIKMLYKSTIVGLDKNRSVLKFADNTKGIQINHSTILENLTIETGNNSAGIYMYVPDNYSYNLCSSCKNIVINHANNSMNSDGILLEIEHGTNIEGGYNLTFNGIDIRGIIKNGIHLHANARQASRTGDTWFSEVLFSDIFIDKAETAILSDWTDISGSNAVPVTGLAPVFGSIRFENVSAQYTAGVSERFCKIMNIDDCSFMDCTPFDYYNLIALNKPVYVFNATSQMCWINMGFQPEIADMTKYINFENATDFNSDIARVIRFVSIRRENKTVGNFYNYVEVQTGANAVTLANAGDSIIDATLATAGNITSFTGTLRIATLNAGNNIVGTLPVGYRPNQVNTYCVGVYGAGAEAGTPVRIEISTNGQINVVATSAMSGSVLRFYIAFIRKYYFYV